MKEYAATSRAFTVMLCDSAPYRLLPTKLCQSARLSLSQEKKPEMFGITKGSSRLPLRGNFPGVAKELTKSGRESQTKQDNISKMPLCFFSLEIAHLRESSAHAMCRESRPPFAVCWESRPPLTMCRESRPLLVLPSLSPGASSRSERTLLPPTAVLLSRPAHGYFCSFSRLYTPR